MIDLKPQTDFVERTSVVTGIKVKNIAFGSVVQFGDSSVVEPKTRDLAVQRYKAVFGGDEGSFRDPLFTQPIHRPEFAMKKPLSIHMKHEIPYIHVGQILLHSVSTCGVVHIGSTCIVDSEARTKHYRQFPRTSSSPTAELASLPRTDSM